MSFPVVIHGASLSQVYSESSVKKMPLGTKLIGEDGRVWRYALKSGAAAVAGDLQQAAANEANHINRDVVTAGAIGDRTHAVTLGATAAAADEYLDGFLLTELDPGQGFAYTIGSHAAVDSAGVFTVPFAAGVSLKEATTTTTDVSLIHNPYRSVVVMPTSPTQVPAGVAMIALTASYYGWLQTNGPCAVQGQGTLVLGQNAIVSGTTAGSVAPSADDVSVVVGYVMRVAPTTEASLIYLNLSA